jgi:magnesium-transporting ATPase (P-type)
MYSAPVSRDSTIINPVMWSSIICNGLFIAIMSLIFLTYDPIQDLFQRDGLNNHDVFLTGSYLHLIHSSSYSFFIFHYWNHLACSNLLAFFCFFIFITNFNSFNVRTKEIYLFSNILENINFVFIVLLIFVVQIFFTYFGGSVLRTVSLTFSEWITILFLSFLIIPFDLLRKIFIVPRLRFFYDRFGTRLRGGNNVSLVYDDVI